MAPHWSTPKFDEKILYKCHQHWIVPFFWALKYILAIGFPVALVTYFLSDYSWAWTLMVFFLIASMIALYEYYLWDHSWLFIGNQKVTLAVRNGLFSQYAMNVRYRNIRDCAVSKHSMWSFLFKYGTIFVRSSANEGDFHANYVPKVGKVYALINALTRYNDDERAEIDTIEKLHNHHTNREFRDEPKATLHS